MKIPKSRYFFALVLYLVLQLLFIKTDNTMKYRLFFFLFLLSLMKISSQSDNKVNIKLEFADESYKKYEEFSKLATKYLEKVLNSEEFRTKLLGLKMKKKQRKTNIQIYNLILKGYEKQCSERIKLSFSNNTDCPSKTINKTVICPKNRVNEINLKVRTINECDGNSWLNKRCKLDSRYRTIGIDGNGDGVTAICPQRLEKWFNEKRIDLLAGHYMHEYMHIIGFSHNSIFGINKYKSAVYQIGYLVEKLVGDKIKKDS